MKILFFSTYFYPYLSGLTIYPWRILNHLSKKHKITVLTFPHKKNCLLSDALAKEEKFKIITLPYLFRLSKGFISPQSLYYFFKKIRQTDLLILNLPNFEGLALAFFGKLLKKKIISIYLCQVDLGSNFFSQIILFFLNFSVYLQCFLSNVIIGIPDYINSTYIGKKFSNKIRTVFPPIVKLPASVQFANKLKAKKNNEVWIGYVGRVAREKGLEYLISAISQLINTRLVIVSPKKTVGEHEYFEKIKNLVKKEKIKHLFLGQLDEKELGAFYQTIDLLAFPSVNQTEAFGMVQVEAMMAGTPVVASRLPGVRIPLTLTKMGVLVTPKNIDQLTEAISKIIKNKDRYTNKNMVKKAQEIFAEKKVYDFYYKLIADY